MGSEDRISNLSDNSDDPDHLLHHILSFLSLDEAVRTCLLSKRWQFIWTGIKKIELWKFSSDEKKIHKRKSLEGVSKMLSMCKNLKKFDVFLSYGLFLPSHVNHWIQILIQNKVERISFEFFNRDECDEEDYNHEEVSDETFYQLPEEFYSYSSLTKLGLSNCVLAPQGIITWGSLLKLRVENLVDLSDSLMEKILSGCPVLKFLVLQRCTGLNNLNINSRNLTTLVIRGYNHQIPNIKAPYLHILSIDNWVKDEYYYGLKDEHENLDNEQHFMLENLASIVEVELRAQGDLNSSCQSTMNHMKKILQSIESVKMIDLSPEHLKVISSLEVEGWRFPLFTQLRCVKLLVLSHEMSTNIHGILALLKSSPNLEALEIVMVQHHKKICSDESLHNYDMDLVASHLKTVKINFFNGRDFVNEYMVTLASILLKSADVLEKMTIEVEASQYRPIPSNSTLLDAAKIVERLLTFPRASSKAVIECKYSI